MNRPSESSDASDRGLVSPTAWADLLRQIIELSTEEHNPRVTLRRMAEFVAATVRADVCFVHVIDHDAGDLVLMGATPPFDTLAGTIRLRVGEGLAGWAAEHGEVAMVDDDKWSDPRYVYIPALRGEDYRSVVSVPLLRPQGLAVGVLNVHSRRAHHFAPSDVAGLVEVAGLLAGLVENIVLYDRLATREAELERFAERTIELQERDRRRMAADIHDGISQRLVSAWYRLRAARELVGGDGPVVTELEATENLLTEALDEARRAIAGLRPVILDDLGLNAAINSLAGSVDDAIRVELEVDECELAAHVETALYRITQEALQNVAKHAQASRVVITLQAHDDGTRLTISDDGTGFDPSRRPGATSYGLEGMNERAALLGARLRVRSAVGEGTTVTVEVPRVESSQPGPTLNDFIDQSPQKGV